MKVSQRIQGIVTDVVIDDLVDIIKRNPNSCNDVWLSTLMGCPKLETHRKHLEVLKKASEKLRKIGVGVSLQLQSSIGHGDSGALNADYSGIQYKGSKALNIVGYNGIKTEYSYCWRDEELKKYLVEESKIYAELKPDVYWIDDDMRMTNHNPVSYGCFCDNCIAKFNKLYNFSYSREELVNEFLYGNVEIREKYIKFQQQGIYDLIYEIGTEFHKISPNTIFGLQNCANGSLTGYGYDYFLDAMKKSTGHTPCYRPGGGAYTEHNATEFLWKNAKLNWQIQMLPEYVEHIYPEVENYPRYFSCKSYAATAFESTFYIANGHTDLSLFMIPGTEPFELYEKAFEAFKNRYPYWKRLADNNFSTHQSGVKYFMSKNMSKRRIEKSGDIDKDFERLNKEPFAECMKWYRIGVPLAYGNDEYDEAAYVLHPEVAKVMTDEDAEFLLTKNVLTDAETIDILKKRGFNFPFDVGNIPDGVFCNLSETMTEHIVNRDVKTSWRSYQYDERSTRYYLSNIDEKCEIISYYTAKKDFGYNFDLKYPLGAASVIFKTDSGAKWAVSGYDLWHSVLRADKRNQLLNILDYISDNKISAKILSSIMAVVSPRADKENKTVSVSITNYSLGAEEEIKLLIRNPKSKSFTFMSESNDEIPLEFKKCDDGYVLSIPRLEGYSVGTIFCDK